MDFEGPFPRYTLIFCRDDEEAVSKTAAFPDDVDAIEHARNRLARLPEDWISVIVADGIDDALHFVGSWDRQPTGEMFWKDASMA